MRLNIALLGLALILLSTQLVSAQAAACDNIWIDAENIVMERADTEYFYLPIYNDYDEDFDIYAIEVWRDYGEFDITLIDYTEVIDSDNEGEITIKIETENLDDESFGQAYIKVRGEFDDETYCGFTHIDETYFDVDVEMNAEEPGCNDIKIDAFNVYINENSTKTISFEIENRSDDDFDLYDIDIEENSSYFDAEIYSKPSVIRDRDSEDFRVRIESNSVSRDRQETVRLEAKGRFDNGDYCSFSSIDEEEFTVYVDNGSGSGSTPSPSYSDEIELITSTVEVEKGKTGYATLFLENNTEENFLIDYVSVFDSSSNFEADESGYEKTVPAFGSSYINVKVRAYDYASLGDYEAFLEIAGHFQNGEQVHIFGDSLGVFPVEIVEKRVVVYTNPEPVQQETCSYFSLIVPNETDIDGSGTVPITIDNRSYGRATIRLYGAGLEVQPKLISVPKKTLITENVSVSTVLNSTNLVYSIEAPGCNMEKRTVISSTIAGQDSGEEDNEETGEDGEKTGESQSILPLDATGFVALGQAGAVVGILVLAAAVIFLILGPKKPETVF